MVLHIRTLRIHLWRFSAEHFGGGGENWFIIWFNCTGIHFYISFISRVPEGSIFLRSKPRGPICFIDEPGHCRNILSVSFLTCTWTDVTALEMRHISRYQSAFADRDRHFSAQTFQHFKVSRVTAVNGIIPKNEVLQIAAVILDHPKQTEGSPPPPRMGCYRGLIWVWHFRGRSSPMNISADIPPLSSAKISTISLFVFPVETANSKTDFSLFRHFRAVGPGALSSPEDSSFPPPPLSLIDEPEEVINSHFFSLT